jgi:hypothetical protein
MVASPIGIAPKNIDITGCLKISAASPARGVKVGRTFSHMVLELRLGVERLRRWGGDHRRRGRRRGASGKSGKNGAGSKDAEASGHWRGSFRSPERVSRRRS